MISFFYQLKESEPFAAIINWQNIYSGTSGYGDIDAHRNIGMLFPTVKMAENKVTLMKHIMFCADKYGIPNINDKAINVSNDLIGEETFDVNSFYLFSAWLIMHKETETKDIETRMKLIKDVNNDIIVSLRNYDSMEREIILNSY